MEILIEKESRRTCAKVQRLEGTRLFGRVDVGRTERTSC
jgi:hypothetical protein